MAMRFTRTLITVGSLFLIPSTLLAQVQNDAVPLKPWPAPLYWQPSPAENQIARPGAITETAADTLPANSLVFVAMTPCRVIDTRNSNGTFGGPALVGGATRSFPILTSSTCIIPSIARAYSFNITIVPPGFVDFITVWPTGVARPFASTLNGYVANVIANAAIVPAGTGGSIDVYASQNTHLIVDINGYYAPQTGINLAQGTAAAPSLSFNGDPGTGIFSSGAGTLNITTGGTSRLQVLPNGNVGVGTTNPTSKLEIAAQDGLSITGFQPYLTLRDSNANNKRSIIQGGDGNFNFVPDSFIGQSAPVVIKNGTGNVGIGTTNPTSKLEIAGQDGLAITGFQPFLTLRDTNASNARSVIQGFNGNINFFPQSFIGGNAAMVVQNFSGSVGIGTTSPSSKLSVNGSADFNGNVRFDTGINNSGQGFKHLRIPVHMEPYSGSYAQYFWGIPFADANYTVSATIEDVNQGLCGATLDHIGHKTAGAVYVSVSNNFQLSCDIFIHLIGIHD
jgi:hypothetical protein